MDGAIRRRCPECVRLDLALTTRRKASPMRSSGVVRDVGDGARGEVYQGGVRGVPGRGEGWGQVEGEGWNIVTANDGR